ncbi:MAG: hypothetical protein Q8P22_04055, partial [Chloroflexota bacterium]|nr:hypothetical protein [Chloroflexota bacterium]
MRTLPAALLAAQKSASALPYLKVEIADKVAGIRRLNWQRLYTGSETDNFHAAAMPADGSLIRCRIDANTLYRQRVTSPGPGSSFSAWTSFRTSSNNCALAAWGALVYAFAVDSTTTTAIYINPSSDNGATWSGWSLLQTAAGAVGYLAAAIKDTNTALLLYSVGATVYSKKRSGGAWGTATAWTNSVASVTGLACLYSQRVTSPGSGSSFSAWTSFRASSNNCALAAWGALVYAFAVDSTTTTAIYINTSSD